MWLRLFESLCISIPHMSNVYLIRGEYGRRRASGDPVKRWKPQIDRDIMLYSESPYIPLSVTASWRFDKSEIVGR